MVLTTTAKITDEEIERWQRAMQIVCAIDPLCEAPIFVSQIMYDALEEYHKKRRDFVGEDLSCFYGLRFRRRPLLVEMP